MTLTRKVTSARLAAQVALALSIGAASAQSPAESPATNSTTTAPADLGSGAAKFDQAAKPAIEVKRAPTGHLLVRPMLNGREADWWIFDTGAGICVISTPHADEFGLKPSGEIGAVGAAGHERVNLHSAAALVLGPVTLVDEPLITTDLSFLKEHLKEEIVGVIGYGLLSRCVVEMDLEKPEISLHDPGRYTPRRTSWTRIHIERRVPELAAVFEGREGRFMLDTGANESVTFNEPAVRKWNLLENREVTDAKLGGVGGFIAAKRGTLASFELGGVTLRDVRAAFATEAKGKAADASRAGTIGAGLLRSFLVTLDYPQRRIALRRRTE